MGKSIHPAVGIGHVHLRVSDLRRATDFYHDVLGFDITMYGPDTIGVGLAFLSAGGYHHQIGLNTFESEGGTPATRGTPACTTLPSSTPTGASWRKPSSACSTTAVPSPGVSTTALASGSTSMTLTAMAWSFTMTIPAGNGPTRAASW
jgi:catechol 2,3-dioxygenase